MQDAEKYELGFVYMIFFPISIVTWWVMKKCYLYAKIYIMLAIYSWLYMIRYTTVFLLFSIFSSTLTMGAAFQSSSHCKYSIIPLKLCNFLCARKDCCNRLDVFAALLENPLLFLYSIIINCTKSRKDSGPL